MGIALFFQFVQGFLGALIYTLSDTLLVDILPETLGTGVAAASNIQCALAALGTGTVQPLISALGRGWYFTML